MLLNEMYCIKKKEIYEGRSQEKSEGPIMSFATLALGRKLYNRLNNFHEGNETFPAKIYKTFAKYNSSFYNKLQFAFNILFLFLFS